MRAPPVFIVLSTLFALCLVGTVEGLRADDGDGTWEYPDHPRLAVRGQSLVCLEGGRTTVLLSAVPPGEAESGAAVRQAHEVVQSRDGRRAVALLTIGRESVALPVRREGKGTLEFAAPISIPLSARVLLSPRDDAFLLVGERDLYRPRGADRPGWNRGSIYVRFSDLAFLRELLVTPEARADLWYEEDPTGARHEATGDFALRAIRWMDDGCLLHIEVAGEGPRAVRLRPRHEWTAARERLPEIRRLLGTKKAELWPVGDGRVLALANDGPHAAEVVLLASVPALRIVVAVRPDERIEDLLCPAFAGELDLDRDGDPEIAFFDWTGIQFHKNAFVVRVSGDRLTILAGPVFCDRVPVATYDPGTGEDRLELARNWWSALGQDGGEVATHLAWRNGALAPVGEERRISAEAADHILRGHGLPPDVRLPVLRFLAGHPFADLPAARAWWAEHARHHRRGHGYVFRED